MRKIDVGRRRRNEFCTWDVLKYGISCNFVFNNKLGKFTISRFSFSASFLDSGFIDISETDGITSRKISLYNCVAI